MFFYCDTYFKGMDTLSGEGTLSSFCTSSENRRKSFLFKVDPFSEGHWYEEKQRGKL